MRIADILYNIVKDRSIKKLIAREAATQIGMPPPHFPQQEQMVLRCNVHRKTDTILNLLTTKKLFTEHHELNNLKHAKKLHEPMATRRIITQQAFLSNGI